MSKTVFAVGSGIYQAVWMTFTWANPVLYLQMAGHRVDMTWLMRTHSNTPQGCFFFDIWSKMFEKQVFERQIHWYFDGKPRMGFVGRDLIACCVRDSECGLGPQTLVFHSRKLFSSGAYAL